MANRCARFHVSWNRLAIIVCLLGAIWLASLGKDGWGWLLFVAVLLS